MIKVRCPICERPIDGAGPAEWPEFPFCSPRCKTIDLGRWLGETYRVAGAPDEDEEPPGPDEENIPP
jgi:endogenous inhibitor of DNA gyrase (YacG/DUF329 family)